MDKKDIEQGSGILLTEQFVSAAALGRLRQQIGPFGATMALLDTVAPHLDHGISIKPASEGIHEKGSLTAHVSGITRLVMEEGGKTEITPLTGQGNTPAAAVNSILDACFNTAASGGDSTTYLRVSSGRSAFLAKIVP